MKRRELIKGTLLSILPLTLFGKVANAVTNKKEVITSVKNNSQYDNNIARFHFSEELDQSIFAKEMREVFSEFKFANALSFLVHFNESHKELSTFVATKLVKTNVKAYKIYLNGNIPLVKCFEEDMKLVKRELYDNVICYNNLLSGDSFVTYVFPHSIELKDDKFYYIRYGTLCLPKDQYTNVHILKIQSL